jgi:hypothetical protein
MQQMGGAMSEFQKIAIGLLGMTHPEIHQLRLNLQPQNQAESAARKQPDSRPGALLRAAKFAVAALLAGSRAIPLGDNGCVTRELGAYGARLRMH